MPDEAISPNEFPDLSPRAFAIALALLILLAFAWNQYVTWTQYQSHRVFLADAGVFDALIAGPLHGTFLRSPLHWGLDANYNAAHFQPALFLITPFYLIFDGVMTYLTILNLVLALAAWPLALLAVRLAGSRAIGLGVALLYLANPFVLSIHLANHPESLAMAPFFLAFLAVEKRKAVLFGVCIAFLLMLKEDFAIYTGLYGLFLLLHKDKWLRKCGVGVIIASLLWFIVAMLIIRNSGQEALAQANDQTLRRFVTMGDSVGEILLFIITQPLAFVQRLTRPALFWLFLSVAFLPLIDWRGVWLIVLSAGVVLIADDRVLHEMWYYYSYPAIPFLFFSTVRALGWISARPVLASPRRQSFFVAGFSLIVILIAAISFVSPTRTDGYRNFPFPVTDRHRLAGEIADLIPEDASVAVQYDLFTFVLNRKVKLPMRGHTVDDVEYVFYDLRGKPADLMGEEKREEAAFVVEYVTSDRFESIFEGEGYFLRRRRGE